MKKENILKAIEFASMIGFFAAFKLYNLQVATLVLMIIMTVLVVVAQLIGEPLSKMQKVTWVVVVGLGVLTVSFKDDRFIQWKSTVINGSLAVVLLLSHFIGRLTIVERLIADKVPAPREMLRRVNASAVVHLSMIAVLNLYFAYNFSEAVWMNFKLFGIAALNFVFIAAAMYYLRAPLKLYLESLENTPSNRR